MFLRDDYLRRCRAMPPNGWLNGTGGERGIKQRDRSFAGKDLFFKVGTESVEEAELALRHGQLVDDVGEVAALGDVEQAQEVTDAVEHPRPADRLNPSREEHRPDEAHQLGAAAGEPEGEVRLGLLGRKDLQDQLHRGQLLGHVWLQDPAQRVALTGDFFPRPPPCGAGAGGDARPCRGGWCCGFPAVWRAGF